MRIIEQNELDNKYDVINNISGLTKIAYDVMVGSREFIRRGNDAVKDSQNIDFQSLEQNLSSLQVGLADFQNKFQENVSKIDRIKSEIGSTPEEISELNETLDSLELQLVGILGELEEVLNK